MLKYMVHETMRNVTDCMKWLITALSMPVHSSFNIVLQKLGFYKALNILCVFLVRVASS